MPAAPPSLTAAATMMTPTIRPTAPALVVARAFISGAESMHRQRQSWGHAP
jgi:hypothetical protein